MARQGWSTPAYDQTSYDPEAVGGGKSVVHYDDSGQGTLVSGGGDSPDEMNRYRGMGAAAMQRQAYQADFGKAQADEAQGLQSRDSQADAAGMLGNAARGNAPSQAGILGNAAAGQSLQAQLGAGANARGMGQAAAQMQAANGAGQQQLGAVGQFAGMRGNEMAHAQGAYGQAGTSMRTGDYAQQAMAQQRAEAQAQSELSQRQLNQGAQMHYEQMGINNQQDQVNGDLRRDAMQNQANQDATDSHDARNARNLKLAVGGMQTIGTLGTGSDERMKQNVVPLTPEQRAKDEEETRRFMGGPTPTKAARYEGQDKDERDKAAYEAREGAKLMKLDAEREARAPDVAYANAADARNQDRAGLLARVPVLGTWLAKQTAARANETDEQKAARGATDRASATRFNESRARLDKGARDTGHALMGQHFDAAAARMDNSAVVPGYRPALDSSQRQMQSFTRERSEADLDAEAAADVAEYDRTHQSASLSGSDRRMKEDVHGEDHMGRALAQGFKPFEYEYKPGFTEAEHQQPGEKNVGPMAQDMAKNPITGSAVKQGPNGLLMVDIPKATKVNSAGIGYLAARMHRQDEEIARLKGGR